MKIDFIAQDRRILAAQDGAIAAMRTVPTFSTYVDDVELPVIVMTQDNPNIVYEVISESVDEFYAAKSQGSHFNLFKDICARYGWIFNTAAALHGAHWVSKLTSNPVSNENIIEANAAIKASRKQFWSYIQMIRIAPQA